MHIALVLSYITNHFGGPVTAARALGQSLLKMEQKISYWAPLALEERRGLDATPEMRLFDLNFPRAWRRSPGLLRALDSEIASMDLLHITGGFWLHPSYGASRIASRHRTPYILRPAGTLEPWALGSQPLKRLKKKLYLKMVGESLMNRAACLHACSAKEANSFQRLGFRGPITIIPNGVDTRKFSPGDGTEAEAHWPALRGRPVVAFMSRLSPEKGLDMLIPVWADLVHHGRFRDAILVIAGPDGRGYQSSVQAMITKHDLQSHILMLGMVQGAKKTALLRRADVFVLPSYSENFGIVVTEALACATPVVTTTGTPWAELNDYGAGRCVTASVTAIRTALYELLAMSESQRQTLGQNGLALVRENYTWDQAAQKFMVVCNAVVKGKDIPLHPELIRKGQAALER